MLTSDFAGRGGDLSKLMDLIEAVTEILHTHPAEGEKDTTRQREPYRSVIVWSLAYGEETKQNTFSSLQALP